MMKNFIILLFLFAFSIISAELPTEKSLTDDNIVQSDLKKDKSDTTNSVPNIQKSYFEEQEERENEIDKNISDNKEELSHDDDGIYDKNEQARDRAGQLTALILISSIIVIGISSYIYLRFRRERRNRAMLVANGSLEQTSIA